MRVLASTVATAMLAAALAAPGSAAALGQESSAPHATGEAGNVAPAARARQQLKVVVKTPAGVPASVRVVGRGKPRSFSKPAEGSQYVSRLPTSRGRYKIVVANTWWRGRAYTAKRSTTVVKVGRKATTVVKVVLVRDKRAPQLQATDVSQSSAKLSWRGPTAGYELRRAVGEVAPSRRTAGALVKLRGGAKSVIDSGLVAGSKYSYSLFAKARAGWSDPVSLTVGTSSPSDPVTYAAKPHALIFGQQDAVEVVVADGIVRARLPKGIQAPPIGAGVVLPPRPGLTFGMVATVAGLGPDSRSVLLVNGTLPDVFDEFHGRVNSSTFVSPAYAAHRNRRGGGSASSLRRALVDCGSKVESEAPLKDMTFDMTPHGDLTYDLESSWGIPKSVKVGLEVTPEFTVSADVQIENGVECSLDLPKKAKSGFVGPVPVAVSFEPVVELSASGQLTAPDLTFGVRLGAKASGEFGVGVDDHISGDLVFEPSTPSTPGVSSSTSLGGEVELEIGGQLDAGVGQASGDIGALAGLRGSVNLIESRIGAKAAADLTTCMYWSLATNAALSLAATAWAGPFEIEQEVPLWAPAEGLAWPGFPQESPTGCMTAPTPTTTPSPTTSPTVTPTTSPTGSPTTSPTTTPTDSPTTTAPPGPCATNDPGTFSTYTGTTISEECVAGVTVRTRGRLQGQSVDGDSCLIGTVTQHQAYTAKSSCGMGLEGLMQARMVNRINTDPLVRDSLNLGRAISGSAAGIDRGVHWETTQTFDANDVRPLSGKTNASLRSDLVVYDPSSVNGKVWVAELKQLANRDLGEAYVDQVKPAQLWWDRRLGGGRSHVLDVTNYSDEFTACGTDFAARAASAAEAPKTIVVGDDTVGYEGDGESLGVVVLEPVGEGKEAIEGQHQLDGELPLACPTISTGSQDPTPDPWPPAPPCPGCEPSGGAFGDPHLITMDGLAYDLQAAGEFLMLDVPGVDLRVQARFEPWAIGSQVSVATHYAMELNGFDVEFDQAGHVWVNGDELRLAAGDSAYFNGGAAIRRDAVTSDLYRVSSPAVDGERVLLSVSPFNLSTSITPGLSTSGLLGDHDFDPLNDLVTRDGQEAPPAPITGFLHGEFADSWRISQESSLFTYEPGQSTETFTRRDFPGEIPTPANYSADEVAEAEADCANVDAGSVRDACILDVLVTGSTQWVEQAERISSTDWTAVPIELDASAPAIVDFNSTVPLNLAVERRRLPGVGGVAGPFVDQGRYSFEIPVTAGHSGLRATTDFVAFGDMAQPRVRKTSMYLGGSATTIKFSANGAVADHGNISVLNAGTLPNGTPWVRYRHEVTVPAVGAALSARFVVGGFGGPGERLGIARLEYSLVDGRESPVGTIELDGVVRPDASAAEPNGVLDSPGQLERWRFTVAADSPPVGLDALVEEGLSHFCGTSVLVRLETGDRLSPCFQPRELDPGTYELRVPAPDYATDQSMSYGLQVYTPQGGQEFETSVGATPVVFGPDSADGSGNLPSRGSTDRYTLHIAEAGRLVTEVTCIRSATNCVTSRGITPDLDGDYVGTAFTVTPGDYSLGLYGGPGPRSYQLTMWVEPAAPPHEIALGDLVQPGDGRGVGILTEAHPFDRFHFVVPEGGSPMYIDPLPGFPQYSALLRPVCMDWQLVSDATGERLDPCFGWIYGGEVLDAGAYTLTVQLPYWVERPRRYGFQLYGAPSHQEFDGDGAGRTDLSVDDPFVIEPDRQVGRGILENARSTDSYSFTTATPGRVRVDVDCTPNGPGSPSKCVSAELARVDGTYAPATAGSAWVLKLTPSDYGPVDYIAHINLDAADYELGQRLTVADPGPSDPYVIEVPETANYHWSMGPDDFGSSGGTFYDADTGVEVGFVNPGWSGELAAGRYLFEVVSSGGFEDYSTYPYAMRLSKVPERERATLTPDASGTFSVTDTLDSGANAWEYDVDLAQDSDLRLAHAPSVRVTAIESSTGNEFRGRHLQLGAGAFTLLVEAKNPAALDPIDFDVALGPWSTTTFDYDLGDRITPDSGNGRGILASEDDVDRYEFTVPSGGIDRALVTSGLSNSCAAIRLFRDEEPVNFGCDTSFSQFFEAGDYTLVISAGQDWEEAAEYTFTITTPTSQAGGTSLVARPLQLDAPGVASGTLESDGSVIDHTVTVTPHDATLGDWLVVESLKGCQEARLVSPALVDDVRTTCRAVIAVAAAGEYHLEVSGPAGEEHAFRVYLTDDIDSLLWAG